jgi:adenosylhomocysteine nucleosidase
MPVTAVVVAVEEELRAIRKRMPRAEMQSAGGVAFFRGELGGAEVVLAKSGMGSELAFKTTEVLIREANPDEIFVAGFCAGMRANTAVGDLIVADEVVSLEDYLRGPIAADRLAHPPKTLLDEARAIPFGRATVHAGTLVSSKKVLLTAHEKQSLGVGPDVAAIDMESAGAVAAAEAGGLPWLAVRAVTDGLNDDLPLDFEIFVGASGEVNRARVAAYVAMRPWLAPALIRLGKRSAFAARNLGAFLEALLTKRNLARIVLGGVE